MKIKLITLLASLLLFGCQAKKALQSDTFNYSIDQPTEGQIQTATRLREYMDHQDYEKAIALFSEREQQHIKSFQDKKEIFQIWCDAWTFDNAKFENYVSGIKAGQAPFIFENGMWKIDER